MSQDDFTSIRKVLDLHTGQLERTIKILEDFIPLVISDLKVINERTSRIEEELKITKRQTDLIPKIHSLLEDDGIEIANIQTKLKKLQN